MLTLFCKDLLPYQKLSYRLSKPGLEENPQPIRQEPRAIPAEVDSETPVSVIDFDLNTYNTGRDV